MSDDLISVTEIAKTHSRHRSVLHKIIKRLGIETRRIRSEEARGQETVYITLTDYSLLKAEIEYEQDGDLTDETAAEWRGFLYIVQLEPQLDPGRFKIGFATSVEDRLKSHKTSAPFATVVRQWPCKLLWEKTAIEGITQECEKLHTEVFRTSDFEIVIARAEGFFALMPKLVG
ncbi:MAG: GIY-YIG nuclease family protein [Hyphomicrobiaceae bacterium]